VAGYALRRFAAALPTLLAIVSFVFVLVRLAPGDPAALLAGDRATQEDVERIRAAWGLDQPLQVQYLRFLSRAIQGDLGQSMTMGEPVRDLILARLPATLELAAISLVLSLVLALPLGIVSAARRNSWIDHAGMMLALTGISVPSFWLGILGILLFSVTLGWLPVGGRIDFALRVPTVTGFLTLDTLLAGNIAALGSVLLHLALPAVALGARVAGILARLTRSSVLEVIGEDFVRSARAKGLSDRLVLWRHVMRNAAIPVVTMVGLQLGFLLSTTIVVESVFSWPGLASFLMQALARRDYALVQGIVLLFGVSFVLINLLVDLLYGLVDPRIRVRA
jgi:ABC-type dipeptide/oligopeptide/nickel transport system permease component